MEKTEGMTTRKIARFACGMLTAGMLTAAVLMPVQVHAAEKETKLQTETAEEAGKVTFSTDYPGVTVKPGGTSTFTLYITNTGSDETNVSLSAEDLPDGWSGSFKGSFIFFPLEYSMPLIMLSTAASISASRLSALLILIPLLPSGSA